MKFALALVAAAGLASVASAQNSKVIFESSADGGATWQMGTASYDPAPGQSSVNVFVRARIQLVNAGTNTVLGLAGITMQPRLSGWNQGGTDTRTPFTTEADGSGVADEPQTNLGRIIPFASAGMGPMAASGVLTSHVDGGNTLRFAGANAVTPTTNLAWGVGLGQLPRAQNPTGFRTGTDVVVFRYGVSLQAPAAGAAREFVADINVANVLQQRANWYRAENGVGNLLASIGDNVMPLNIRITPTPGALALLGLGGLAMARRRR